MVSNRMNEDEKPVVPVEAFGLLLGRRLLEIYLDDDGDLVFQFGAQGSKLPEEFMTHQMQMKFFEGAQGDVAIRLTPPEENVPERQWQEVD